MCGKSRKPFGFAFTSSPACKLVEKLGIVAKTVREEGAGIVYGTQAIRPFYIRGDHP